MAYFKTSFLLGLLLAVLLISSKASARNEPAGVAKTEDGKQVDHYGEGGGGWGWNRGGGGWNRGGGGWGRGGGWCHYPYCNEGAGSDETHQAKTGTKFGETEITNTNEHADKYKPNKPKP